MTETLTPIQRTKLSIQIHGEINFTEAERQKHKVARDMLLEVLNSVEFELRFKACKFTGTMGKNNDEIYEMLMSGTTKFHQEVDHDLDLYITMYYASNNTVGYTYPSTFKTWLNRKFFSQYDYADIACNLFHEYLHNLGFGHSSAKDHTSLPYQGGYLVESMIREILMGVRPSEKKQICYRSWKTLWIKRCYWE